MPQGYLFEVEKVRYVYLDNIQ